MTQLAYERVHLHLAQLRLATIEEILDNTLDANNAGDKSFLAILDDLLAQEVQARRSASIRTRTRLSALPAHKSLDDFDYAFQPSLDRRIIEELRTLRFLHNAENVVLLGPPGVGKSHIAIGLALDAIQAGHKAYYATMSSLIERLKQAQNRNQLETKLRVFAKTKVLIIDEIGYQRVDAAGANLFFELVTRRYEKGSTIFTSNKSFGEWGDVFGDAVMASALLDRILHHATVINIKGDSYRMKSRRRTGSLGQVPPRGEKAEVAGKA